ncbi:OsmC family peroxiredoxin [Frigidibacter sp. ROC022]|uniref:OsmC family peroxiredoxin n=1 Tax=Frigidibacter sp. ROC022 TaxID=2971796 RepID=UPI00215A9B35|nr:OsmC family peroxiredoxin [Frigidibacter sp. ROC022]MCR8723296.1 OsmC family peroxiredoxin [Frigidibacter sp. ROC022]
MIRRHATATWAGGLKDGTGTVTSESGTLNAPYAFAKRFGEEEGSNPEELIAAAHAGCYAMALSGNFDAAGVKADRIECRAEVSLDLSGEAPTVTRIHLTVEAAVPGLDAARFQELVTKTKDTCPISRLLAAAEITVEANLA